MLHHIVAAFFMTLVVVHILSLIKSRRLRRHWLQLKPRRAEVLAWLPKSALDVAVVAHFYEAVLAVLSVLIWHSYVVIFDPEVFPMDTAWLTGRSRRHRGLMSQSEIPAASEESRHEPPAPSTTLECP
jgi:hypothetical protein